VGIYSHVGQRYEPVDRDTLLYYKEARDGQILEEGITEAGAFASFIAAGTANTSHGINMIPFFMYYSMFGFQRIGDLIWAAGDMGVRGFMFGATAGRTTLAGEGLQHQDGHSHVLAMPYPHVKAYDPAFAFELAILLQAGLQEMYVEQKRCIYYITVGNEPYAMPPAPEISDLREQILRGLYLFKSLSAASGARARVQLLGSGAIMGEVLKAAAVLSSELQIDCDVWSVTSYKQLHYDLLETERFNRMHPGQNRKAWVEQCFQDRGDALVAASDYNHILPAAIAHAIAMPHLSLGTDGFGLSESRADLRAHFEVNQDYIVQAALAALVRAGKLETQVVEDFIQSRGLAHDKPSPMRSHWA
ncbi:MAG: pyruvate dehydrogenase (acetyl-transferring), homodimeric type, partial [Leptospiraceae bacterium]|nr:pyruvate dehydrogenase (acetyl-transferring), homodimeric type [Leptospiraceae bacterium]